MNRKIIIDLKSQKAIGLARRFGFEPPQKKQYIASFDVNGEDYEEDFMATGEDEIMHMMEEAQRTLAKKLDLPEEQVVLSTVLDRKNYERVFRDMTPVRYALCGNAFFGR